MFMVNIWAAGRGRAMCGARRASQAAGGGGGHAFFPARPGVNAAEAWRVAACRMRWAAAFGRRACAWPPISGGGAFAALCHMTSKAQTDALHMLRRK